MAVTWSRINTVLLLLVLFVLIAMTALLATRVRGGPLDPPTPPGPTLPQVEPRNPIPPVGWNGTFPIAIDQAGSYYLTRNLTGTCCPDGIVINASGVTLDLNGFTLTGPGSGFPAGINVQNLHSAITIRNGTIRNWGAWGINANAGGVGLTISEVIVLDNGVGIELSDRSTVRDSVVIGNTAQGVRMSDGNLVHDNLIVNNAGQFRISGQTNRIADNHIGAGPNVVDGSGNYVLRNTLCSVEIVGGTGNYVPTFGSSGYEDTGSGHLALRPERNVC
jgi:hypothetical protein